MRAGSDSENGKGLRCHLTRRYTDNPIDQTCLRAHAYAVWVVFTFPTPLRNSYYRPFHIIILLYTVPGTSQGSTLSKAYTLGVCVMATTSYQIHTG